MSTEVEDSTSNPATETKLPKTCARCKKEGTGFPKCSRCKDTFYCTRQCQQKHWSDHKEKCIPPEKRPKPPSEDVVVDYVECESFEDCRDHLIKHNELINKQVSDEMFEKGFLALKSHPPEIGTRFIRNAQILQYLLDLREVSGGQQDVTLFFARILDPNNSEYKTSFTLEYQTLVKRILTRFKEKEEAAAAAATQKEPTVGEEETTASGTTDENKS